MKGSQRIGTRHYHKSSLPRLRWTPQLHELFVETVESLGGQHKATPKRILQTMSVKGLKISQVKSHLQMYRSAKDNNSNVFLPILNHLHEERAHSQDHSFSDVFSIFSPQTQRPSGNRLKYELKKFERVMYSESDDEIKGPIQTQEEAAGKQQVPDQDTDTSAFSRLSADESRHEFCELSLSSNPMMTRYRKEREFWPSTDEHNSYQSSSTGHFSNTPDFLEVGSNRINLDLTI